MGLGEIRLGEMGLGEMGQNRVNNETTLGAGLIIGFSNENRLPGGDHQRSPPGYREGIHYE